MPDLLFVIDVGKEDLAIAEAKKLGIPVVGVVDTNCSARRGWDLHHPGKRRRGPRHCALLRLVARAALDGMSAQLVPAGVDNGRIRRSPRRILPEESAEEQKAAAEGVAPAAEETKAEG